MALLPSIYMPGETRIIWKALATINSSQGNL